jgi:hypothetical protein
MVGSVAEITDGKRPNISSVFTSSYPAATSLFPEQRENHRLPDIAISLGAANILFPGYDRGILAAENMCRSPGSQNIIRVNKTDEKVDCCTRFVIIQ